MSITRPNQERSALTSGVRCVELRRVAVGVMGLAIVLLVLSLSGCSSGPPAHGTSFLVALDTNSLAGTVNHVELLGHTREVLRQRLENLDFRFAIEPAAGACLLVKIPRLSSNDLAAAREVISRRGQLEFRR